MENHTDLAILDAVGHIAVAKWKQYFGYLAAHDKSRMYFLNIENYTNNKW